MSQFRSALLGVSLIFLLSVSTQSIFAQGPSPVPSRSYEVSLHVIVGSNGADAGAAVPQSLANVVRELKPQFSFQNYRLANTYFGRIGTAGTLEYKSVTSITGQDSESDSPSFLEWSIGRVDETPDAASRGLVQAQPFRFGARVPVRMASVTGDGKTVSTVSYESIGFNVNKLSFRENVPTLVGSLNLPKTAGTLFLVVTAKQVD
jgi:hypothetical protein